jgi:hypothetical protein
MLSAPVVIYNLVLNLIFNKSISDLILRSCNHHALMSTIMLNNNKKKGKKKREKKMRRKKKYK